LNAAGTSADGLAVFWKIERPDAGEHEARQVTGGNLLDNPSADRSADAVKRRSAVVEVAQGELDRKTVVKHPQASPLRDGLRDRHLADRRRPTTN
jgi:hypothetical protein